jgi:5S rRNA maturation endonuclease (ribonuclease M5)
MDGWTDREVLEGVIALLQALNELDGDAVVLVEGKKDVSALRSLGVKAPIEALNQGMELYDLLMSITGMEGDVLKLECKRTVVVMTDWDRKGGLLASRVRKACARLGILCDTEPRRKLVHLTGRFIRTVESLPSLVERLGGAL